MWVRLIGSLCLLGGCGWWAAGRTAADRAEVARIQAAAELLTYVGREIAAYCLPLDEIAAALPPEVRRMCAVEDNSLHPAMEAMAARISDAEAAETLRRVAAHLGRGGCDEQVTLCRDAAQTLAACAARLSAQFERRRRERRTLCVTGCFMIVILLW